MGGASGTAGAAFHIQAFVFDTTGAQIGQVWFVTIANAAQTRQFYTGTAQMPADASTIRVRMDVDPEWPTGDSVWVYSLEITRAMDTDLIVQNAITADKIAADAIVAKHYATAASGQRWDMDSSPANEIRGYSGRADEAAPGSLVVDDDGASGGGYYLKLSTGRSAGHEAATLSMHASSTGQTGLHVDTDSVGINGRLDVSRTDVHMPSLWTGNLRVVPDAAGGPAGLAKIYGIDAGYVDDPNDTALGLVAFNHSLGRKPTTVFFSVRDTDSRQYIRYRPSDTNDSQIWVSVYDWDGGTSINRIRFWWLAIAFG